MYAIIYAYTSLIMMTSLAASRAPVRGRGSSMKIAWKNTGGGGGGGGGGGKKRSRPTPTALNPNLPFEREDEHATATARGEVEKNDGHETSNSDHHIKGLVDSFRAQGNQLAEVICAPNFALALLKR